MIWILPLFLLLLVVVLLYFSLRRKNARIFEELGVDSPPAPPVFGHYAHVIKHGLAQSQMIFQEMYRDKKVYGLFDGAIPALYIKDPDLVKEICIKNFSNFCDRRHGLKFDAPFHDNLLTLKGQRWKHVRSTVSPIFSSLHIKKMVNHVERTINYLLENLQEKQEKNEEVNLKDIVSNFTLDVIAGTGFGIDLNSFKDPDNPFVVRAKRAIQMKSISIAMMTIFPQLTPVLAWFGLNIMDMESVRYLVSSVDNMLAERETGEQKKHQDFLDLLVHAKNEEGETAKGMLSKSEVHGVALNFIFAGFDTVSSIVSLTVFTLAHHPECLQAAQEELDSQIGMAAINYENVQELSYLEMCINETMRLYPGVFVVDRQCIKTTTAKGLTIPEGLGIVMPIYAIHHDPDIWPEPEEFKPERFSPEASATRHPCAFLPFGQGPRNCIGMRLAIVETRMAVASILQKFTPVPCSKSVYPIALENSIFPIAKDGLWLKFEARKQK